MIRLGVLDQSPVPQGSTPTEALADTVALAVEAERLGYGRYWLAEHHNTASLAGTAPEVTAAVVASATEHIRVGSGGVMLSHYSPFKVAELFRTLAALFPGRIDLGFGRAAGTDAAAEAALRYDGPAQADEYFARRVLDLVTFLGQGFKPGHRFDGAEPLPRPSGPDTAPALWMLASSGHGGSTAASLGLSLCFAHFITPSWSAQVVGEYRRRFSPSPGLSEPRTSLAVSVICAETGEEARHLALSNDVWRLKPEGSGRGPLLSPEAAAEEMESWGPLERERAAQKRESMIVGDPKSVAGRLTNLAEQHDTDELIVVTVCHDPAARVRSYRLLAEQMNLPGT